MTSRVRDEGAKVAENAHTPPIAGSASGGTVEILQLLRSGLVLTKTEVAARTGLSRSTINQRIDALLETRLVVPSGAESTKGRPAESFAFNRTGGHLLVADIGATGLRVGLCDLTGMILNEVELTISVTEGPDIVLGVVGDEFARLLAEAGAAPDSVVGIGVSVPGPVDTASGQVVHPPIMTGWDQYDIPGWFRRTYDCPVVVEKDANAMAFGEQQVSHPTIRHLLMVKVGTGVGSGLISDGRLHHGADGAAGDIGHNYVSKPAYVQEEPECRCGNIGCLEAYAGGWAILRDLQALSVGAESVDDAVRLLRSGNRDAVRLARNASQLLGEAIAVTVNLFNPQVVVIGGQLAAADDYLFAGIKSAVYHRSLPLATRRIHIVGATQGKQAGIIGLALLVAQSVFANLPLPTLRSGTPQKMAV
jgi:predicted NBD/HSP70 family sugar kinase